MRCVNLQGTVIKWIFLFLTANLINIVCQILIFLLSNLLFIMIDVP